MALVNEEFEDKSISSILFQLMTYRQKPTTAKEEGGYFQVIAFLPAMQHESTENRAFVKAEEKEAIHFKNPHGKV
eukprot:m.303836 g.303836  ORF g.303836 m.303836 type:complete len:75 (-) comp16437_c0_seq2:3780-4004(-)